MNNPTNVEPRSGVEAPSESRAAPERWSEAPGSAAFFQWWKECGFERTHPEEDAFVRGLEKQLIAASTDWEREADALRIGNGHLRDRIKDLEMANGELRDRVLYLRGELARGLPNTGAEERRDGASPSAASPESRRG